MSWTKVGETAKILRDVLIAILGGGCSCQGTDCWHDGLCPTDDKRCLQIDHIRGDGAADRKRLGGSAIRYYLKHIDEAKSNLQLLCANCNWVKRVRNAEVRNGNGNSNHSTTLVVDDTQVMLRVVSQRLTRVPRFLELTDKFYGFWEQLLESADTDVFSWLDSNGLTGKRSLTIDLARQWKKMDKYSDQPEDLARFVSRIILNLDSIIASYNRRVSERLVTPKNIF